MTSPTTTLQRIRNSGAEPTIIFTKWDGFARTDVISISNTPFQRVITINGGANAAMIRWSGQVEEEHYLKKSIDFLPYYIRDISDVAIIGAGGGRDVLQAVLSGAKRIDAIEINNSAIEAVKIMKDFNGDLYSLPQVNVIAGDGRSVISKTEEKYDLIFISLVMTDTTESLGLAMAESYIYTEEAIKAYYGQLKEEGLLVFLTHSEIDLLKASNTAFNILIEAGKPLDEISDYFIIGTEVTSHGSGQSIHSPVAVISKSKFSPEEINRAQDFFRNNYYGIIQMPGVYERNIYAALSKGELTLDEAIKDHPRNIAPATDNKPFFYNYDKGVEPIFIILIFVILVISFLILVKSLFKTKGFKIASHFSLIGLAFMLVEISFIQKVTLFLEHPTRAFVITVASLLIGAGIGSIFSYNKLLISKKGRHYSLVGVVMAALVNLLFFRYFMYDLLGMSVFNKVIISSGIMMATGVFMGMIFPFSIRQLEETDRKRIIPLVYGVNGIFSVIGSILAVTLSMQFGIQITLVLGMLVYGMVFVLMPKLLKV